MKKIALVVAALIAVAMFLAAPAFPGTVPASLVPEGAKWVVHLDMEKFVATKLFAALDKDGRFEIKDREASRWLKMDLTKDVAGVTVFGLEPGGKGQVALIVSGKFDKARLLTLLELAEDHAETSYGAYTLYSTGDDGFGAFVNDTVIVLSESQAAVEKVLDTAGGKAKSFGGSALSAALKDVPAGAFLSGVMPDLSSLSRMNSQSKVLEKASGLSFTAQETQDMMQVRLQVTADTPDSAKNMFDIVNGIVAMGRLGGNEGDMAGIAALLDGLQVKQDGKVLRIDFARPSQQIADLVSQRRGFHALLD